MIGSKNVCHTFDHVSWQQVIIDMLNNREEKQQMLIRTISIKLTHYTNDFNNDDYKRCMHVSCESSFLLMQ